MPERIVDFRVLQRMALRIGQHVDSLHAAHGEAFVRILLVVTTNSDLLARCANNPWPRPILRPARSPSGI